MTTHKSHSATPDRSTLYLLWGILVLLATVLRLANLAAAPLSAVEAGEALPAYFIARGVESVGFSHPVQYSPLLFHANTLLFVLFDGGDGLARLVPALAGVGLVLTPLFLRRALGQWGALGMGLLLALSPTTLFFSRLLNDSVPAALGVMILMGCGVRFWQTRRVELITMAGLGLALALTAGATAWGLLLGLAIALIGVLWVWRIRASIFWSTIQPVLGRGLGAAALGAALLGSGLGLNPAGLAMVGEQFLSWLARFRSLEGGYVPSPLLLLPVYEPLILLFGLAGLVLAVRKRKKLGFLWIFWTVTGVLQWAVMPAQQVTDLLWLLLPLAGLGGIAIEELVCALRAHGSWLNEGLHLPISLALWTHLGLTLARYARGGNWVDLAVAGMVLLLQFLITSAFGFVISVPEVGEKLSQSAWRGIVATLRAGGLSVGVVLLAVTFSTGLGLAHLRPADPTELPVRNPTAIEVRTLANIVEQVAMLNTGVDVGLPVTFLGETDLDPALVWALRKFDLYFVDSLEPGQEPPLVIASSLRRTSSAYFGETLPLHRVWIPQEVYCSGWPPNCQKLSQWWLYRSSNPPIVTKRVSLWVHQDLGVAGQ